jgi:hypothetical protein
MLSRSLAIVVSCALTLGFASKGGEPDQLLPGSPDLAAGAWLADTLGYRFLNWPTDTSVAPREIGRGRQESRLEFREGRQVLTIVSSFVRPTGTFADTATIDATTYAPLSEVWHSGDREMQMEYRGPAIHRRVLNPDTARSDSTLTYATPVFGFNELHTLARALPLRAGYHVIAPLYSENDNALEHDTLTVLGREPSGVWNVRFTDAVIRSTYGIDERTRRIVRFDVRAQHGTGRSTWILTRP